MSPVREYTLIMCLLMGFNVKNTLTHAQPEPSMEERTSSLNN